VGREKAPDASLLAAYMAYIQVSWQHYLFVRQCCDKLHMRALAPSHCLAATLKRAAVNGTTSL
jgi:hypothetical protein